MAKAIKTSAEGRRCKYSDCRVILSIYNHEKYCRVHRDRALREEKAKSAAQPAS